MTGNKLEIDIIGLFNRDITLLLSINQVAKKLKKAYPHINSKVNELIDDGILTKFEVGRSYLCSINLASEKAVALLSLDEAERKEALLKKAKENSKLPECISEIRKKFNIYTIISSEDKLFFVLPHVYDGEAIKNVFPTVKKFSPSFVSKQEFSELLLKKRCLLTERVVLYSPEKYFELVNDIKNELFSRYSGIFGVNGK